jgi:WD40 repeat protein
MSVVVPRRFLVVVLALLCAGPRAGGQPAPVDRYGEPLPAGAVARLGTVRFRQQYGYDRHIAFVPGGRALLSTGSGGDSLVLWDATTGKQLRRLRRQDSLFRQIAFSPDGKVLASAGALAAPQGAPRRGVLTLWDPAGWKEQKTIPYPDPVEPFALAWSPDGKALYTGNSDGTLRLWDVQAGTEQRRIKLTRPGLTALVVSANGRLVAAASDRQRDAIFLWDPSKPDQPRRLKAPPNNGILSLALAPDGGTLATGSSDEVGIRLWDVKSGRVLRAFLTDEEHHYPRCLAFSRDGKFLAAPTGNGRHDAIVLWDVASGQRARRRAGRLDLGSDTAVSLALSADGRLLAAATSTGVRLWDLDSGRDIGAELPGHRGEVTGLVFSPRGDLVVTAGDDHTARVWEAATGRQRLVLRHDFWVRAVAVSPDGKLVASSSLDDTVRLWDAGSGREIYRLPGHGRVGGHRAFRFSADGKTFTSWGDDQYLRVWSTANGKALRETRLRVPGWNLPDDDEDDLGGLDRFRFEKMMLFMGGAIVPGGARFILASGVKLHVFDVVTGKLLPPLADSGRASYPTSSPDGEFLVATDMDRPTTFSLWRLPAGKPFRRIALDEGTGWVAALSPDNRTLATITRYPAPRIDLWEVATARRRLTIDGIQPGSCLAFSPDSRLLATGMADGSVLLWELTRFRK